MDLSNSMPSRLYQKKRNLIDFLVVKTDLRKNVIIILGGCRAKANISMLAATVSFCMCTPMQMKYDAKVAHRRRASRGSKLSYSILVE